MIPAFNACTESPEPGISTRSTVSAIPITSISLWPGADRLEQDEILARRVEQERRLQGRLRQTAEVAARPHRADEDLGVEEVVREADPVAEQRSLRERARRVDRDHAHRPPQTAHVPDERAHERRLADAGRPGDADHEAAPGLAVELAYEVERDRVAVLDQRDRARESAPVARANAGGEIPERPLRAGHAQTLDGSHFLEPAAPPPAGRPSRAPLRSRPRAGTRCWRRRRSSGRRTRRRARPRPPWRSRARCSWTT